MSAIDPAIADKIFDAIQTMRDYLPEAEAISALVPGYGPEIVAGEVFLGKLFKLVVTLRGHDTIGDAQTALRKKTEEAWKAAIQGDPR